MLYNYCIIKIIKTAVLVAGVAAPLLCRADDETPSNSMADTALTGVVIDENRQRISGIRTIKVSLVRRQTEYEAVGKVVSVQPLLALRERYLTAQAELEGALARQKLAELHLNRQKELFRSGVAPKRSLQDQEAQGVGNQAAVAAAQAKLSAIVNEAKLNWGLTLAEWALATKASKLTDFISARRQLLQIYLPANKQLAGARESVMVESSGNRAKAKPATLVSSAALVDNTRQGQSYFFQTEASDLSIGMKVTAWISDSEVDQNGVIIPESALIWYLDQACVYLKTGKDTFSRRVLRSFSTIAGGYFIGDGLGQGDEIVMTGGQMLLSEELKHQIPDED